jgi:hypothetical protein
MQAAVDHDLLRPTYNTGTERQLLRSLVEASLHCDVLHGRCDRSDAPLRAGRLAPRVRPGSETRRARAGIVCQGLSDRDLAPTIPNLPWTHSGRPSRLPGSSSSGAPKAQGLFSDLARFLFGCMTCEPLQRFPALDRSARRADSSQRGDVPVAVRTRPANARRGCSAAPSTGVAPIDGGAARHRRARRAQCRS